MAKFAPADPDLGGQLRAIDHPHQIALALLAYVLAKPKSWILAHPETHLSAAQKKALDALLLRLEAGEPLPYLLGNQEFFGLNFAVSPVVLIPRPETELLVQKALDWLTANPHLRRGLDVGTGSGCIAISLVSNCPDLCMIASDISTDALALAQQNANLHNVHDRIRFVECDLIPADPGKIDFLCANLPYIPSHKLAQVNSLPWEPSLALDGGEDGLRLFRKLFTKIRQLSSPPSLILLEIEDSLGKPSLELCRQFFPTSDIHLLQDLSGRDRLLRIEINA